MDDNLESAISNIKRRNRFFEKKLKAFHKWLKLVAQKFENLLATNHHFFVLRKSVFIWCNVTNTCLKRNSTITAKHNFEILQNREF